MARIYRCSLVSEVSILRLKRTATPASDRSSGTPTALASSNGGGPTFPDGEMLLPTPKANEWKGAGRGEVGRYDFEVKRNLKSISYAGGFPASPSAPPADARPATTNGGSGPSSPVSLGSYDPERSSSRTSEVSYRLVTWTQPQASLFGDLPSERFSGTWPTSGMTRRGRVFALPMSGPATGASASSSWLPTPAASDDKHGGTSKDRGTHQSALPDVVKRTALLHTPTATDSDGKARYDHRASPGYTREKPMPNLMAQVEEVLATPTAWLGRREAHSKGDPKRWTDPERSNDLSDQIAFLGDLTSQPSDDGNGS